MVTKAESCLGNYVNETKYFTIAKKRGVYICTLVPNSNFFKIIADLVYDWFCIEFEYHGYGGICIGLEGELKHDFFRTMNQQVRGRFAP
jgi:hypothetical protein